MGGGRCCGCLGGGVSIDGARYCGLVGGEDSEDGDFSVDGGWYCGWKDGDDLARWLEDAVLDITWVMLFRRRLSWLRQG